MIVCFSCPQDVKSHLDTLVDSGQYADYAEVVCAAVRNLAVLHIEVDPRAAVIVSAAPRARSAVSALAAGEAVQESVPERRGGSKTRKQPGRRRSGERGFSSRPAGQAGTDLASPVAIPSLFSLFEHGPIEGRVAPAPDDVWRAGQAIPIERWIFGQFNRLLPAKASCRAIANLAASDDKRDLEGLASAIGREAASLGAYLRKLDASADRSRDEHFATAFPRAGQSEEKGVLRYAGQFVAATNSNGQLSGLLVSLKLINRLKGTRSPIGLTEAGWAFAALRNPVLDQAEGLGDVPRFSEEETHFLLKHIAGRVPAERFAYISILEAIEAGNTSPDSLDDALGNFRSQGQDREASTSFLSSQRSGAVSRMSDLGLVERSRTGVRVEYAATELGKKFLATTSTLEGE